MGRIAVSMTSMERRASFALAGIFAMRMMGLFLILPVFALYAEHLPDTTPVLVGLAIGAYGLSQAIFQIPAGLLSDRIGRKPVIVGGLVIFAAGSVVAATAQSIEGIIVGRAIQGSGAIAAAVMALAADLTRDSQRTKAMAVIGMSIGLAFAMSLIAGPLLHGWIDVPGIFWLTAGLAVGGILLALFVVPSPADVHVHRDAEAVPEQFGRVLRDPQLLRLDFGILTLHMVLTAVFLVVPLVLRDLGLDTYRHWLVYLPVLALSVGVMVPFIIAAERRDRAKGVLLSAIALLGVAIMGMALARGSLLLVGTAMLVFFSGFNILEAILPSLISKQAPAGAKGTAMGVYSTSQFAGAFLGGGLGGWFHHAFGIEGVLWFMLGACLLWLTVAAGMRRPLPLSSRVLTVSVASEPEAQRLERRLLGIPGVVEAVVVAAEGSAYLKIDNHLLDTAALDTFAADAAS